MTTAASSRVRAAVLAGAAALTVLTTGACNDASPADAPGTQQDGNEDDGGDDGRDGGGGDGEEDGGDDGGY